MKHLLLAFALMVAVLLPADANAELRIDVTRGEVNPMPVPPGAVARRP